MLIHYYVPVYQIVRDIFPDIATRKVLDFGCNCGHFLETAQGEFPLENYTGIDVCEDAIDAARKLFPTVNFIHYDGFNPEYNPGGKSSIPALNEKYDVILVNSVITHTSKEEMLHIVDQLLQYLAEGGKLLVSWTGYDPSFNRSPYGQPRDQILRFFPEHKSMDYCYVVQYNDNGKTKSKITQDFPTEAVIGLWSYYNVDYFKSLFQTYDAEYIMSNDWKQDYIIFNARLAQR